MAQSTIQNLTNGLENTLVQYGTIDDTSFTNGKYTLIYPKAFKTKTEPVVLASANAGAATSVTTVGISGVSTTQATIQLVRSASGGTITTPNLTVRWIAIGERP